MYGRVGESCATISTSPHPHQNCSQSSLVGRVCAFIRHVSILLFDPRTCKLVLFCHLQLFMLAATTDTSYPSMKAACYFRKQPKCLCDCGVRTTLDFPNVVDSSKVGLGAIILHGEGRPNPMTEIGSAECEVPVPATP